MFNPAVKVTIIERLPVKVLFDHTIRCDAIRAEHCYRLVGNAAPGMDGRVDRPKRQDWRQHEIERLPEVANLVHKGAIQAFTTQELHAEYFRAAKFPSPDYVDIFEGMEFPDLTP